jgi:hypothetical protein
MKPIPLLLGLMLLATGFRLTIAPLICRAPLTLTDRVTFIRTICLPMPAGTTNHHQLAAGLAGKFDTVRH